MAYKKCPICELNYIPEEEEACPMCTKKRKLRPSLPEYASIEGVRYPKKKYLKRFYFVFQGADYARECTGRYIFAPTNGPHHWERLTEVYPDDIIFHADHGYICALSVATSHAYDYMRDGLPGRKVDCNYLILNHPLRTARFIEEIKAYPNEYSPFNKNGKGNQGYLFDINTTLSNLFLEYILAENPSQSYQIRYLCKLND